MWWCFSQDGWLNPSVFRKMVFLLHFPDFVELEYWLLLQSVCWLDQKATLIVFYDMSIPNSTVTILYEILKKQLLKVRSQKFHNFSLKLHFSLTLPKKSFKTLNFRHNQNEEFMPPRQVENILKFIFTKIFKIFFNFSAKFKRVVEHCST